MSPPTKSGSTSGTMSAQVPATTMKNHGRCGGPGTGTGLVITRSPTSAPPPYSSQKEWPPSSSSPLSCRARRRATQQAILESQNQQLRTKIQRLRVARLPGADPGHVDASFDEYAALRGVCMAMARTLVGRGSGGDDGGDGGDVDALRASFGGLDISDPVVPISQAYQATRISALRPFTRCATPRRLYETSARRRRTGPSMNSGVGISMC